MSESNKSQDKSNAAVWAAVWAAVITGIVTLVVGFLGFPPLVNYLDSKWNSTSTPLVVPSPSETFTVASEPMPSSTTPPPQTPTLPPPATPSQAAGVMTVQISSNYSEGNAPFTPTFRAGKSYVTYQDGKVETCEFDNVCSYSWDVREKNGPVIHGPEVGGMEFSFTFTRRGEYTVVVYVCRGQVCSYAAANVTIDGNASIHTKEPTTTPTFTKTPTIHITKPTSTSTHLFVSPNPTLTLIAAFKEVDDQFKSLIQSYIVFNKPTQMKKGGTASIELLLNPSASEEMLATQLFEQGGFATSTEDQGTIIGPGGETVEIETSQIEITPRMKAVLLSQDPEAFNIIEMHDSPEQVVNSVDTTTWRWSVTAKKEGTKTLELIIYQLVLYRDNEFWHEVETYKANISVEVTITDRIKSLDWKWIASAVIIPVIVWIWGIYRNEKKKISNKENSPVGKKKKK